MTMQLWREYLSDLEELAGAEASRQKALDAVERERLDTATRAERATRDSSQVLAGLTRRVSELSTRIRRFALEVGVPDAPPSDIPLPKFERIPVVLADLDTRLANAQDAQAWLARFTQSALDHAAELERQRLAAQKRAAAASVGAPAPQPAAVPQQRGISARVVVILAVTAVVILAAVVAVVVFAQ
ncbi:MAG: hypothetical protein KF761_13940 [Salinibacterium sp.]|nr:hypothetical protein [Salinibacterium sp.]